VLENREIKALLQLIDDPDEEIYLTVSDKIISMGKGIIPNLENLWENSCNESIQERIEQLIHQLHYSDLTREFDLWLNTSGDLLSGSIVVAKYHYPDLETNFVLQEIEKLRRNIWLELNNYLTPLEKINVLNSIFYNYYKQKGAEINYDSPEQFLINKVLESKCGNAIGNGLVYLILTHLLDIPVRAVNIPRQFLLAYFDEEWDGRKQAVSPVEKILFYLDPYSGQMYSHNDIENYLKRLSVPVTSSFYRPMSNTRVIQFLIEELSKCFDNDNNRYKMDELKLLANKIEK
jgi:regulator of sirC expression with transglutaminase-like and TPR domain